MNSTENYKLGQEAYAAYADACKGKDGLGRDILPWPMMSKPDQQVWIATGMTLAGAKPYQVKTLDDDALGKLAYDAYCGHVGWKSSFGDSLPEWGNAREHIREGWRKAGMAVMFATAAALAGSTPPKGTVHIANPSAVAKVTVVDDMPGDENPPVREGALKYELIPDDGSGCQLPTSPEGMTAEELGPHITGRLLAMERQGYWSDVRQNHIPLQDVTYTISVAETEDELEPGETPVQPL